VLDFNLAHLYLAPPLRVTAFKFSPVFGVRKPESQGMASRGKNIKILIHCTFVFKYILQCGIIGSYFSSTSFNVFLYKGSRIINITVDVCNFWQSVAPIYFCQSCKAVH